MNIIIEGPDATGKTTLAEKLIKKYNMNGIIHSTSKTRNDLHYHIDLLDYHNNTVFDRFHIGEMIFPEMYKREGKLSFEDFTTINRKIIDNHDILIILYTSDISILNKRLIERGELDYLKEIEEQNEKFAKWAYILASYEYRLFKFIDIADIGAYEKLDNWIDEHYNEMTPNIVYRNVCRDLIEKGHTMETRNIRGNTKELCNYLFTINSFDDSMITLKTGHVDIAYIAGELLWYWSGRQDTEFISKFSSMWSKLSDDGINSNSAYGYILKYKHNFDQIEKIIELLKVDKYSRRAVLNLNVPNENVIDTKDEICTICLIYQIRNDKLHCTCVMRSNDIKLGVRNDIGYFLMLQQYIAEKLCVECGSYTHFAASMHVYDRDFNYVKNVAYGTLDSEDLILDTKSLISHMSELIYYVDNNWINKEDFKNKLISMNIIKRKQL